MHVVMHEGTSQNEEGAPAASTDESRFEPGRKVLGHYTVVRHLGRGGMGTVYLARDEESGQEVAVKVLPASLARERDIRERFVREARALASLDHPNIVPLVTFAQEGEDRFLVMKYIAGESLDARVRRVGVLSPEHARKVLRPMIAALGYAHSRGVIHRDIKPSNVLIEGDLEGDHRIFIVDFGIAKRSEGDKRLTHTGMLMGTPQYMSPEQISGQVVDPRSDLYAAGLVLFEMLAGRPPFDGPHVFEVLRAHVERPVPDVREMRGSEIPDDLLTICRLLLRKRPEDRPRSAAEVAGLLDGTAPLPRLLPEDRPSPSSSAAVTPRTLPPVRSPEAITGSLEVTLDDELAIKAGIRPRRAFMGAAAAFVAIVALVTMFLRGGGSSSRDETADSDAGTFSDAPHDGATVAVLFVYARDAMAKKDWARARVLLAAILEKEPENAKAIALRDENERELTSVEQEEEAARQRVQDAAREREKERERQRREKEQLERERRAPDSARPPSELSADEILAVTSTTNASVKLCYEEQIQTKDRKARGELVLRVSIQPTGQVDDVVIRSAGRALRVPEFQACVQREVKRWRFRPFRGEPDVLIHTFSFRPGS